MKKLILVLGFLFLGIGVIGFFYGVGAEPVNALLWLGLFGLFAVPCFALVGTIERVETQEEQLRGLNVEEGYKAFLSKFLTEAVAGILLDCIERDVLDDRQRLARYITGTLSAAIPNALITAAQG